MEKYDAVIDAELFWRLRREGKIPDVTRYYETDRLKQIANRMRELRTEWDELDREVMQLAKAPKFSGLDTSTRDVRDQAT